MSYPAEGVWIGYSPQEPERCATAVGLIPFVRWIGVALLPVALLGLGRHDDRRLATGPAGEPRRHTLPSLHHVGQGVETPRDEHVGGVGDTVRELIVGASLGLGSQLTLFGDASVGDLRLVLVEPSLRVVVVADQRDRDAVHLDPRTDAFHHVGFDLLGELSQVGEALRASGADGVEGVELPEHLVERSVELTRHDRVADPVHASVVAVEGVTLRLGDAPANGVVHTRCALVADADVGARSVGSLTTTVSGVGVGLDAGIQLGYLLPGPLCMDAVAEGIGRAAEGCHHADVAGVDHREAAEHETEHPHAEDDDGDHPRELVVPVAHELVLLGEDEDRQADGHQQDGDQEKPRKGHTPCPFVRLLFAKKRQ